MKIFIHLLHLSFILSCTQSLPRFLFILRNFLQTILEPRLFVSTHKYIPISLEADLEKFLHSIFRNDKFMLNEMFKQSKMRQSVPNFWNTKT